MNREEATRMLKTIVNECKKHNIGIDGGCLVCPYGCGTKCLAAGEIPIEWRINDSYMEGYQDGKKALADMVKDRIESEYHDTDGIKQRHVLEFINSAL